MNKRGKPDYNRNVKLACHHCGYIARTTRKWLEHAGPAHCPNHGAMMVVGEVQGVPVQTFTPSRPIQAALHLLELLRIRL